MAAKTLPILTMTALALAVTLGGCKGAGSTAAQATGGAPGAADTIKERQANFKEIGKSTKAIKIALDTATPDFAAISAAAATIHTDAGKITGYFPAGTGPETGVKTMALPVIWQKPDAFKAAAAKLVNASAALKAAADAKDAAGTRAALGNTGGACKGCHEEFRKEEK